MIVSIKVFRVPCRQRPRSSEVDGLTDYSYLELGVVTALYQQQLVSMNDDEKKKETMKRW